VCDTTGWKYGEAWIPFPDGTVLESSSEWYSSDESLRKFRDASEEFLFHPGVGLAGGVWASKRPEWIPDVSKLPEEEFLRLRAAREAGLRAALAVPILADDRVETVLVFFMEESREEEKRMVELISAVAAQLGSALRRKRAEESLERYTVELERSNRLKDLFTDIISHDLMNRMAILKGAVEILEEEGGLGDWAEFRVVIESIDEMEETIDNAARIAKLEGHATLDFEECDLGRILEKALEKFQTSLEETEMEVVDYGRGRCPAEINPSIADVFENLVSNAIKYSPPKTQITVGIVDAGEEWRIYLKDLGVGVPDEYKEEIFDRFERRSGVGLRGSGLGLAIVKHVVELHQGRVWVEDHPGGGSIFYVSLPKRQRGGKGRTGDEGERTTRIQSGTFS
jgi:signal transduction histidine kinase